MEETKNSGKTNIDLLGDCRPAYRERAQRLKTRLQNEALKERQNQIGTKSGGLTADQYWKQRVRSQQDVVDYYKIYRQDIPEEVARAIAIRFTKLLEKINSSKETDLTEDELKYFQKVVTSENSGWDPKEEIEQQKAEALVNKAEKAMKQLLTEL